MKNEWPPKTTKGDLPLVEAKEKNLNLEDYFSGNKNFKELIELSFTITDEKNQDLLLKQWVDLVEKYPKQADDFMELFAQNPFGSPKGFIDAIVSVITKPGVSPLITSKILGELNTQFWYRREEMTKVFLEYLNFSDYKNISRSGFLLEYITFFIEQSDSEDSFYTETVNSFEDILKEKTKENKGSYLLNIRSEQLLEKRTFQPNIEYAPFQIINGKYAMIRNNELYLADKKNSDRIKEILEISQKARESGNKDAVRQTMRDINELEDYFIEPISNELFITNKPKTDDINDFAYLQKTSIRNFIQNEFNIKFSDLSIPEQFQILQFIKYQDFSSVKRLESFASVFSKSGFRTFLSIEQGGKEMGDKIISLGEKLPKNVAQKVFTKYGEIIDNISKITEFTRTNFTKEIETNPRLIEKIEETLYLKGKQLLSQTYNSINNQEEINYEEIDKQLERINADTITTFAIFKQAIKNGEKLPIESIEGTVFSKKEAINISLNQQNEMLELYELNWKNHNDRNFVESLKSYFKTAFIPKDNKQKNYFYTFEKDNNIRAFLRFEQQKDTSLYASALNVDEASKNFGLGEAMMDEALTREAKEHILHASCRKDNPSNMRYFEKGFIAKGFKKTNKTEEFDLIWDEDKNINIVSKQKSQGELIDMYGNTNTVEIEIRKSNDLESLHGDIPEGKSLVRCFVNNREWYAVYETIKEDYGMNLGETK